MECKEGKAVAEAVISFENDMNVAGVSVSSLLVSCLFVEGQGRLNPMCI